MSTWRVWADLAAFALMALLAAFFVIAAVNGEWGVAWFDVVYIAGLAFLRTLWAEPHPSYSP